VIIWRMRIACRITKTTNGYTQFVYYSLFFYYNNGCKNAPHCYVIRTLPVLSFYSVPHGHFIIIIIFDIVYAQLHSSYIIAIPFVAVKIMLRILWFRYYRSYYDPPCPVNAL